ncbi:hypothetical protein GH729_12725 [Shewanella sp. XMDDZSB0408]|nr:MULTISPECIES: hypothetical protein [Shewanella]MRG36888.1 hypothetical protein [Shewanella sp. XMDDZSB0408]
MRHRISAKICPFVQRETTVFAAANFADRSKYMRLSDKPQWCFALN